MRDLVSTLILLGAVQGAVLSLVLWQRVANRVANRTMAALVALVTLMLLAGEIAKLEESMDVRRAYLDPNLTLTTLADALGITPHMLSQLLNVWVGKSFFVYVNGRRVEALMTALADPRNAQRGVLDLGFEVGFSSKSTLNSFFKKHTSTTPTAFRARALAQKSATKSHG